MKLSRSLVILVFCLSATVNLPAQFSNWGNNEFYVADGLLSLGQFEGILNTTKASSYMSFPYSMSGAAFLTYRHYFDKKIAVGVTIGLDNQTGDLSYGRDPGYNFNSYSNSPSGYYRREVYTGAVELLVNYRSEYKYKVYGYIGCGYTSAKFTFNFFDNIPSQNVFYGTPGSMFLHKNTTVDFSHFSGQITPIGFRRGEAVAWFVEFGFGYKGLVSGGLSVKFNNGKHLPHHIGLGPTDETLLLPADFPTGADLEFINDLETHNAKGHKPGNFELLLHNISAKTNDNQGNVFKTTGMSELLRDGGYRISGKAYYSANFDSFKTYVSVEKKRKFENGKYAYITVYNPGDAFMNMERAQKRRNPIFFNPGNIFMNNRTKNVLIAVNDSLEQPLDDLSKCVYKVTKGGPYKVALKGGSEYVNIDVQLGKEYYIKIVTERPRPLKRRNLPKHLVSVSEVQGNLESSVIDNAYHIDLNY
jgi:hypothetical protein